jgi:conserved domain protein
MGTVGGGLGKLFFDDAEEYVDLDAQDYRLPDGTRLTNAMAEELVDEVERHGLAGRPHLDPEQRPSVHLAFRVPSSVGEQVDSLAKRTGRRRSDVLRAALDAYLKESA